MSKAPNEPTTGPRAPQPRPATSRRTPDQPCLNCGDTTHGDYCPSCGQAKRAVAVSVRAMLSDVLEDQLVLSRALPRTLVAIFFRPGFLTTEYIKGRIVRYIAPFRLYLAASVVFFLLLSVIGLNEFNINASFTNTDAKLDAALDVLDELPAGDGAQSDSRLTVLAETRRQIGAAADSLANDPDASPAQLAAVAQIRSLAEGIPGVDAATPGPQSDSVSTNDSTVTGADAVTSAQDAALQPWARSLQRNIDPADNGMSRRIARRFVQRFGHLPPAEASRELAKAYLQYVPHMMFVALPIFALILKLLYIRRRRYYAEHFVFALHFHAFAFLMFILMLLIQRGIAIAILCAWVSLYLWIALKRVYRQGFFRTTLKYALLGTSYGIVLIAGLAATLLVTLTLL